MAQVLVTRPQPAADRQAQALRAHGHQVQVCPTLVLEARTPAASVPAGTRAAALDAAQAAAAAADSWFFVSPTAVRFGWPWLSACRWPEQRCYAVGPETASALRACGVAPEQTPDPGSAEQLLAMPALLHLQGRRALVVRGEGGLPTLPDTLRMRGAQVELFEVYARVPVAPSVLHARWQAVTAGMPADALRIVVSSGDGLRALCAAASAGTSLQADRVGFVAELQQATLLVPSPRVSALADAFGFARVIVCAGASDAAVIAALA